MTELNGRYKEVFDFIVAFKAAHDGVSPSVRDIVDRTSITSTSIVHYYLHGLEDRGWISFPDKLTRSIKVNGGRWVFAPEDEK